MYKRTKKEHRYAAHVWHYGGGKKEKKEEKRKKKNQHAFALFVHTADTQSKMNRACV